MNKKEQMAHQKAQREKLNEMAEEVKELELRARYWKGQYDVRYYTLESTKLLPEYDAFLEKSRQEQEEAMNRLKEAIEKQQKAAQEGEDAGEIKVEPADELN